MIRADIESLLQQAMGLDPASVGSSTVERAIKERLSILNISDTDAYLALARTSATELQALIEAVIVPETWFFRDREAFQELARVANQEWLPKRSKGVLRLLSLPCSSGEEPYSMAMALLDTGFPEERCRIDAVDISDQALAHARCALYAKNSFRGTDLAFRERHFKTTALRSRLSDVVRRSVHFQQGNLFAEDLLSEAGCYDIIFCRNLLIYFDLSTQDRAVQVLQRLLKPTGVLFVGPSESGLLLNHGFISSKVPLAFAFRGGDSTRNAIVAAAARPEVRPVPPTTHRPLLATDTKSGSSGQPNNAPPPQAPSDSVQIEAFMLADQGRMAEAEESCEKHLRTHGPSANSFFLMGLIRAAAGDLVGADQYYRKALYLDRNHHDTLIHLGLLLEKQGNAAGAQVIRDRFQRLQHKRTA